MNGISLLRRVKRRIISDFIPKPEPIKSLGDLSLSHEQVFDKIKVYAIEELFLLTKSQFKFRNGDVFADLKVFEKGKANIWPHASLLWGLVKTLEVDNDRRVRETISQFLKKLINTEGLLAEDLFKVDQCLSGYCLLNLHSLGFDYDVLPAIEQMTSFLLKIHPRSETGLLPYMPSITNVLLVDTLGMICPMLSACSLVTGNLESLEFSERHLEDFLDKGLDERNGLPFHAYHALTGDRFGITGWSRGIGWLMLGLSEHLRAAKLMEKPSTNLVKGFQQLSEKLLNFQREDGCWSWMVHFPDAPVDTSGTAMIAYSLFVGIKMGLIEQEFLINCHKALNGILSFSKVDGRVDQSLGDTYHVGLYSTQFTHTLYAQGFTLALCSLIMREKVDEPVRKE